MELKKLTFKNRFFSCNLFLAIWVTRVIERFSVMDLLELPVAFC
jgi:hypothetical protein